MFFNRHKSALDDLQQTLTQQNGLLDAINRSMAVIEFDLDAVVLSANDNFLKTMGYRAEQAIGQPHRLFCTPEFGRSAQYSELWSRLKRGEFQSGTFERINSKGESVWLEASYNPIKDAAGHVVKVVKYAMDVTAKVQQESEANAKLQAIDRAMAVIEFNLDGSIITANQNFLTRMGYTLAELKGKHHRLFCTAELVNSSAYQDFWRRLNQGEFFQGQFERIDKRGQTVWLEANYNPVYDASGRLCKVVKFASDVTARVEQHEQDARSASAAYHISVETRKVAEQGTQVIQQAASEMREIAEDIAASSTLIAHLGERSEQITAIVNTIRGIADQTNLLALNAAIEAARAGEQGRGFAVVADEVRQLAARTSGSTAEISNMIGLIQSETRQAIKSMDGTRDRAAQGVELADQAGTVILQIRDGASEAVQAVSMFANERAPN
ncbi:PAS domain-containing methyl-accepting chemotaxis protein [Pseudomonas shahriarae]|uniref:PAS domain-containing methyl-accepting chemotaxis protein n=1 Tax=Pseudomonas shahriarae TaxID=2745512 RepID=A0A9X4BZJ9_9PSED|nr:MULTISPECIES: PAS domain-containing methyl-accepting chemotaxis protein [Pseudomonas]MBK3464225.1 PAS domain-containing methyl-accepting chemotaxis protein [Pseudomonas sp. MF6776]MDD1007527.1 PAS domain-containing methyl-accepting chemotaxis protein [Pseudomonas shahriarae]